jgi:general stress protein YciG
MPNNNPQGHNQYTKRREPMPQAADTSGSQSIDSTSSAPSPGAPSEESTASTPTAGSGSPTPAKRGFAAMDEATQRTIASKGGQSQGKENNPGNFANDRDRAREAGRKGGEAHGHRQE